MVEIDKMFLKYIHKCKGQRIAIEPTFKKKTRRFTLAHSIQAGQGRIYLEPQLHGRLRQENAKVGGSLGNLAGPCLNVKRS